MKVNTEDAEGEIYDEAENEVKPKPPPVPSPIHRSPPPVPAEVPHVHKPPVSKSADFPPPPPVEDEVYDEAMSKEDLPPPPPAAQETLPTTPDTPTPPPPPPSRARPRPTRELPKLPGEMPAKKKIKVQITCKPEEDFENRYFGKWDCMGSKDSELTFKQGDVIYIISKEFDAKSWWVGELNGKFGLVPKTYLTPAFELVE